MAVSYTWKITICKHEVATGGIIEAYWQCDAADGDIRARTYGSQTFVPDSTDPNFTPYDQVTEDQVLGWVWGQVDKTETESLLAAQISEKMNPVVESGTPWG